jgi:subtilisin family serine protease
MLVRLRGLAIALAVCAVAGRSWGDDAKIAPWLASRLAGGGEDSFLVLFDDASRLDRLIADAGAAERPGRAVYDLLRGRARLTQTAVRDELTRAGIPFRSLYLVNGLAVRGDLALARKLALHTEVVRIVGDPVVRGIETDLLAPQTTTPTAGPEWGVSRIDADKVWTLDGVHGEGIVVASADTGVDWTHPALIGKYRGWNGTSASHDYNWFDAIADTAVPFDDYTPSHGTHTTGTMVGDDGAGNQVGVAPGAKWIACRNMNVGNGQPSTYIACNQFFLAPFPHGGDPEVDGDPTKAPNVINNSWGCPPSEGCDPFVLESSFAALRAAGIMAAVAAGNAGPNCSTVIDPPSIYAESFVAAASDISNVLAGFSSRGPVTVDSSGRREPDVDAPGVNVRSTLRGGGYGTLSGTSMATPHLSGAVALLWSARPQLRGLIGISRCLVTSSARPILTLASPQTCGGTTAADTPNDFWGYGLIDAYDAIHFGPDTDGDGIADACDCAPTDGGAFQAPTEVTGLRIDPDKVTLEWSGLAAQSGAGTVYDVISGDLSTLRVTGTIDAATCLGTSDTATSRVDPAIPTTRRGFYYLVEARNACGVGGFGTDSYGTPRAHDPCP